MSIKMIYVALKEAEELLYHAKRMAKAIPDEALVKAIGHGISALRTPLALADPGKTWLEETDVAWGVFGTGEFATSRFAAGVAAVELRKSRNHLQFPDRTSTGLSLQIADLEAIAKGGGE